MQDGWRYWRCLGAAGLLAQDAPLPSGSVGIDLAKDSPVALVKIDYGRSRRATARGAALVLDLHMGFTLRNDSSEAGFTA